MLISLALAWLVSQSVKVIINLFKNKSFSFKELIFANGGMPSAHTASCISLTVSAGLNLGFDSFAFAISLLVSFVVMVDAAGVRRETGRQSKILNAMNAQESDKKKLKENIGHTPAEIVVGAVVGALSAVLMHVVL